MTADRILCLDENCVGVIGVGGFCGTCGRPGPAPSGPGRLTCPDELCTGILGDDQRCGTCGWPRPFAPIRGLVQTAAFATPLDLGLGVSGEGVKSAVLQIAGLEDVRFGDRVFDDAFHVRADEPDRARALLGPELRATLVEALEIDRSTTLDDRGLQTAALRASERFVELVERARTAVPPPSGLVAARARWAQFAAAHGLVMEDTPLRLRGPSGDATIEVTTGRAAPRKHRFSIRVTLAGPLHVGLRIVPRGFLGQVVAGVAAGDDDLARNFAVSTHDGRAREELVDEATGARLLRCLRDCGYVVVDDRSLTLRGAFAEGDPDDRIPALVLDASTILAAVAARVRAPAAPVGPYR